MAQTARAARMCRRTHPAWPLVEPRVTLSHRCRPVRVQWHLIVLTPHALDFGTGYELPAVHLAPAAVNAPARHPSLDGGARHTEQLCRTAHGVTPRVWHLGFSLRHHGCCPPAVCCCLLLRPARAPPGSTCRVRRHSSLSLATRCARSGGSTWLLP